MVALLIKKVGLNQTDFLFARILSMILESSVRASHKLIRLIKIGDLHIRPVPYQFNAATRILIAPLDVIGANSQITHQHTFGQWPSQVKIRAQVLAFSDP